MSGTDHADYDDLDDPVVIGPPKRRGPKMECRPEGAYAALAAALTEARKETAYWKAVVEDPGIYWGQLGNESEPPTYWLRDDDTQNHD